MTGISDTIASSRDIAPTNEMPEPSAHTSSSVRDARWSVADNDFY